jgi:membrane fusion protein (multidrug efflux system)
MNQGPSSSVSASLSTTSPTSDQRDVVGKQDAVTGPAVSTTNATLPSKDAQLGAKIRVPAQVPIWVIGLCAAVCLVIAYVYVPRLYFAETDDAYVQADTVTIVPKIGAYVIALHVGDNTRFAAGQLLVELDPRDFQVAVESAEADLHSAEAAKANVESQLGEQDHVIAAAQAMIESDRATLEFAEQQLARYGQLAREGSGSAERAQQAQSDAGQRRAALQHDLAALDAAKAHLTVLQSQLRQAEAAISRQQAGVAQARLNLSYTRIYATVAGRVANRTVQVGNFVQPGQTLFSAVPEEIYVIANFKETQLTQMQAGQPALVRVDAFPDLRLRGHVDSFQRGTGSNFALLPPENATGNFVKVVQRVPVKIILDDSPDMLQSLSPGMSLETTVTVRSPPVWLVPLLSLADPRVTS